MPSALLLCSALQASIFEACAETKGKLQLPVFLKLLHGDTTRLFVRVVVPPALSRVCARSCQRVAEVSWSEPSLSSEVRMRLRCDCGCGRSAVLFACQAIREILAPWPGSVRA